MCGQVSLFSFLVCEDGVYIKRISKCLEYVRPASRDVV